MKSIPPEIAIRIFRLLHQRDKLQCMLVCSEWESIIRSTVLFETLRISSKEGLDSVLSTVQQESSYGMQVKRLIFQVHPDRDFDVAILPTLFPNVLDCYINPYIIISPHSHPFRSWHNRLTQFFEQGIDGIEFLIKSNIWSNMTTLKLSGNIRRLSAENYIYVLKNTPGLKTLKLHCMKYSMDDFEFIHSQLSSLKSLSLKGLSYDGSNPPANIIPATSVTSLFLGCITHDLLSKKKLFSYVSRKYPNVSDLNLHVTGQYDIPGYSTEREYDEWDGVLVNLASCLQKIDLRCSDDNERSYVLKALDERHCQLESLSITAEINATAIKLLSELNLVKHLESFKIIGQWYNIFAWIRPMTMLKELEIDSGIDSEMDNDSTDLRIPVNDIMDMCGPHLQSIIFRGGVFSYNMKPQDDTLPVFNQIKKFEFDNMELPVNIGAIISRCFPQLHTLRFSNCFGREDFANREIHLVLPDINLQSVQVFDDFSFDRYVLVITLCDNKRRMYTTGGGLEADFGLFEERFGLNDMAVFSPPISMDYDAKPVDPFMIIVCNSLKDIRLVDI
jgi:hypothetical protein